MKREELINLLKECGWRFIGGPGESDFYQRGNVKILLFPVAGMKIYRHRLAKIDLECDYHQLKQGADPWVIGPITSGPFKGSVNIGFNLCTNKLQTWTPKKPRAQYQPSDDGEVD